MVTASENLGILIDSLTKELPAAMTMWRFAALMPTDSIPWPWLREITVARHPEIAGGAAEIEILERRLIEARLLMQTPTPAIAQMPAGAATYVRQILDASSEQQLGRELRAFVWQRLQDFKATRKRLLDEALRDANGGREVTAWTVPSPAVAVASAVDNKLVQAFYNGDGSFSIGLREGAMWEESCLKKFCKLQFESSMPDSIEWALRTGFVPHFDLKSAQDRVTRIYESDPENRQGGIIHGLLLLNSAHHRAGQGSWRGAWGYACAAVDVFAKLREMAPNDVDVLELLKEAENCRYLYDD